MSDSLRSPSPSQASDIATLKQQNAELREQIRSYKDALLCTREYINDIEWRCKFATDKAVKLQAEKEELLARIAEMESALDTAEALVSYLAAKLWLYETGRMAMVPNLDASTPKDIVEFVNSQEYADSIADYVTEKIEGGDHNERN